MKVLVLVAAFVCAVYSQHDHHKSIQALAEHLFTLVDEDRNGMLSHSELEEEFKLFDENHDNRVTEREFYDRLCLGTPEMCSVTIGLFQELDTLNELVLWHSNVNTIYSIFDTNGNGDVTRSEFVTWMTNKITQLRHNAKHHG